jgi:ABC-type Fe3+ transport system permease subunit
MVKKIALLVIVIMLITPALSSAYGWYYWTGRDGTSSIWEDIGDWLGDIFTVETTQCPGIWYYWTGRAAPLPIDWEPIGADG